MKKDIKLNDALKALRSFGFEVTANGNHIKMRNTSGLTVSIPHHKRVKGSTLSNICKSANIDKQEFFRLV